MALRWVNNHISSFGGDPKQITVIGQSAGGGSTHLHVLSASSDGLFQRAIAMSGSAGNVWASSPRKDQIKQMMDIGKHNTFYDDIINLF